jgi:oligopeptide transport system ATP-binding protein
VLSAQLAEVSSPAQPPKSVLKLVDLKVHFPITKWEGFFPSPALVRAVDGVSLDVGPGETLGIVGESGCGKSTMVRAVVGLAPITSGQIWLGNQRIDGLSSSQMLPLRREVQMIFQDPYASLNPRLTVGAILREPMEIHRLGSPNDRKFEVMRLMELVGLDPRYLNRYPHEFSGGQRQRIGIARALAVEPKLILCDEPVSALDVSIQAQVVNLLMDLQQQLGVSYIFITHDLAVVQHIAHRVGVMYFGRIVELADRKTIQTQPKHPYTQALWSAAPIPDPTKDRARQRILLKGDPPSSTKEYPGCPFVARCPIGDDSCKQSPPQLLGTTQKVACFKA